jgi:hypothetical protein
MLKITGDGRKAALDMRLADPFADAHGDTKVGRAVDRIRAVWEATRNERSRSSFSATFQRRIQGASVSMRKSARGSSRQEFRNTR